MIWPQLQVGADFVLALDDGTLIAGRIGMRAPDRIVVQTSWGSAWIAFDKIVQIIEHDS